MKSVSCVSVCECMNVSAFFRGLYVEIGSQEHTTRDPLGYRVRRQCFKLVFNENLDYV